MVSWRSFSLAEVLQLGSHYVGSYKSLLIIFYVWCCGYFCCLTWSLTVLHHGFLWSTCHSCRSCVSVPACHTTHHTTLWHRLSHACLIYISSSSTKLFFFRYVQGSSCHYEQEEKLQHVSAECNVYKNRDLVQWLRGVWWFEADLIYDTHDHIMANAVSARQHLLLFCTMCKPILKCTLVSLARLVTLS